MMNKCGMRFIWALAIAGGALLLNGCGTIRGEPPSFSERPGDIALVEAPLPPESLETSHLRKRLEFPPPSDSLAAVNRKSTDPNLILYPNLRVQTEDEVVKTEPMAKGDVTTTNQLKAVFVDAMAANQQSFLAVIDLKNESAQAAASGRLAADFLYRAMKREAIQKGLNLQIVDREMAFLKIKEDAKIPEDQLNYSDEELFDKIKQLKYATFFLSGAVTTFSLENKELEFGHVFNEDSYAIFSKAIDGWGLAYQKYKDDYQGPYAAAYRKYVALHSQREQELDENYRDYQDRYADYTQEYLTYIDKYRTYVGEIRDKALLGNFLFFPLHLALEIITFGNADTWAKAVPYPPQQKLVEQPKPMLDRVVNPAVLFRLPEDFPERHDQDTLMQFFLEKSRVPGPVRRMATVCNVGITIRLVEGQTSEILWIGNGTVRSTDLQAGMQEVCEALIAKFFKDCGL